MTPIYHKSVYAYPCMFAYMIFSIMTMLFFISEAKEDLCTTLDWANYKTMFGKYYANKSEDAIRKQIFCVNLIHINRHNAQSKQSGFELGLNHMSDWNDTEIAVLLGYDHRPEIEEMEDQIEEEPMLKHQLHSMLGIHRPEIIGSQVPDQLDWRDHSGRVSPVRNQGDCGACWAFSIIGLLEGQQMKDIKGFSGIEPLSVQNLLDCDVRNGGCQGGVPYRALNYIASAGGLLTERDYPYFSDKTGSPDKCRFNKTLAHRSATSIKGPVLIKPHDEEHLKEVVATFGPVTVSMEATWFFYQYREGIFYEKLPRTGRLNHAVLLIGYGTTKTGDDYWIVKNSWGVEWGEKGYGRIARNRGNHCGIEDTPVIYRQ